MQTILNAIQSQIASGQFSPVGIRQVFNDRTADEIQAFANECPPKLLDQLATIGFNEFESESFTMYVGIDDALAAKLIMEVANQLSIVETEAFSSALKP